jgi:hypothetical protein
VTAEKAALGIDQTLAIFSPLLKSKDKNPKAVLLTLFMCDLDDLWNLKLLPGDLKRAVKFLPTAGSKDTSVAEKIRNVESSSFFRNVTKLFDQYKKSTGFDTFTSKYGMKIRQNNRIVAHWPMRPGKNAPQAVFDILEVTGASGCERYVEWERVKDDDTPSKRRCEAKDDGSE